MLLYVHKINKLLDGTLRIAAISQALVTGQNSAIGQIIVLG